jgi:hypothetical protein
MRNLHEYPVTKEEILDYLARLQDEVIKEDGIGDMRPLLLAKARQIIEQSL